MNASTITVEKRTFNISKPRIHLYLKLLGFIARLYTKGAQETIRKLGAMVAAVGGGDGVSAQMAFMSGIQHLDEVDIYELSAILLQFEDMEEGMAFVAKHWELGWFLEAITANVQQIGIGAIVKNFGELRESVAKELIQEPKEIVDVVAA